MPGITLSRTEPEGRTSGESSRRVIAVAPSTIWLVTGILVALGILVYLVAKAVDVVVLLFIAIIFAEAVRPIVDHLGRWHVPRPLAVLGVYPSPVILGLLLIFLLLRPVIAQTGQLQRDLPRLIAQAQREIARLRVVIGNNPFLSQLVQMGQAQLGQVIGKLVPLLVTIPIFLLGALVGIVAIAAVAFFWLTVVEALRPFVLSLMPESRRAGANHVFALMGQRLGGYVRGVVINMFVIGILRGLVISSWVCPIPCCSACLPG